MLGDRLRKAASVATEENRHDDAFLMDLAAEMIRALVEGGDRESLRVEVGNNLVEGGEFVAHTVREHIAQYDREVHRSRG